MKLKFEITNILCGQNNNADLDSFGEILFDKRTLNVGVQQM